GLDIHLPGASKAVEIVHVKAAQVCLQCVEDVGELDPHCLHLFAVDVHVKLRRTGAETVEYSGDAGQLACLECEIVRLRLQGVVIHVAGRLHHQLEPARIAQTAHSRRTEYQHAGVRDFLRDTHAKLIQYGIATQVGASPIVERLEDHEQ